VNVDPEQNIDIVPAVPPSAGRKTIFGTGEMADLTRVYDWSQTPVGSAGFGDREPDAALLSAVDKSEAGYIR
jgi:hypothetical protein